MTRGRPSTQLLGMCIALVGCATVASPAYASFGLRSLEASFDQAPPPGSPLETLGPPDLQAGSHPYQFTASFAFNMTTNSRGEALPDESVKDLQIELPPGLAGNPKAVPQCSMVELASGGLLGKGGCPADTQVGVLTLHLPTSALTIPIFNLLAPAGVAAQFGVDAFTPIVMGLALRPSDYGMVVSLHDISQAAPLVAISMALWGVPADPGHDGFRGTCLKSNGTSEGSCPSGAPLAPLLTMPTSCGEALTTAVTADSWQNPGTRVETSTAAAEGDGAPSELLWLRPSALRSHSHGATRIVCGGHACRPVDRREHAATGKLRGTGRGEPEGHLCRTADRPVDQPGDRSRPRQLLASSGRVG